MNLELNLETKPIINPNIAHFSKAPVVIDVDNESVRLNYLRNNTHGHSIDLILLNRLYDYVDAKEFAYETGMRDIVDFKQYLIRMHSLYQHLFTEEENFVMGVTKKYAYSKGTYDTVKTLVAKINKYYMRPSGMNSIFNRIEDNRWAYNNFRDNMTLLEKKRFKAKNASGNMVNNIDDLIQSQTQRFDSIEESTNKANQMTDNFEIINCINANVEELIAENLHTAINVYTIVKCHAKEMTIINNSNREICKMSVPTSYLYFRRPLWRALTTDENFITKYEGSAPGARHPYINSKSLYDSSRNYGLSDYAWGQLCLSSYQDDVINSLNKNDYMSFVMGLMNWNNIYNKDQTNPYFHITKVMSSTTFPIVDSEKANIIKTSVGFNKRECFYSKCSMHTKTEIDYDQRERNSDILANIYPYANYILNECNQKQCPLRGQCSQYESLSSIEETDYKFILEDIVGNLYGTGETADAYAYDYQYFYSATVKSNYNLEEYFSSLITDRYKDNYDYWGDKETELTEQEISFAKMQDKISQWEQQQAASGGINE